MPARAALAGPTRRSILTRPRVSLVGLHLLSRHILVVTKLSGVVLHSADATGGLTRTAAFFLIRTEPRWPLPLERNAPAPRLEVSYTGLINAEVRALGQLVGTLIMQCSVSLGEASRATMRWVDGQRGQDIPQAFSCS